MSNFRERLWHEIQPLVIHGSAVLVLYGFLIVFNVLAVYLPPEDTVTKSIKLIDAYCALILVTLFGIYTVCLVALRLKNSLKLELDNKSPEEHTQ